MDTFEERLAAALEEAGTGAAAKARDAAARDADAREVYLAAVSGGADSTAMLAALAALREKMGFTLHCVHVEHGIRPAAESQGDALAVKALCETLDVPCRIISVPPGRIASVARNGGPGIEGAARFFRRRALAAERRRVKAGRILTAHTQDDLLENLLMRVLRGAGPAGLAAMPRARGRFLRPLLTLTRRDALRYLEKRNIPYRTDSTNADIAFFRNRVRHKLIPVLERFFPSWRTSLLRLAETQSLAAQFLAAETAGRLPWEGPSPAGELVMGEERFMNAPLILREEAVFAGADTLASFRAAALTGDKRQKARAGVSVPKRAAVRCAVRRAVQAAGRRGNVSDLGPVRLERKNGSFVLKAADGRTGERGFSLLIKSAGLYTINGKVLGLGKNTELCIRAGVPAGAPDGENSLAGDSSAAKFSARFLARFPLVLRNHAPGDRVFKGGRGRRFSDILDSGARSGYTGVITACDADGPAAFIGVGRDVTAVRRDGPVADAHASNLTFFEVSIKYHSAKKAVRR